MISKAPVQPSSQHSTLASLISNKYENGKDSSHMIYKVSVYFAPVQPNSAHSSRISNNLILTPTKNNNNNTANH